MFSTFRRLIFIVANSAVCFLSADLINQTPTTTVILPNSLLPFTVSVEEADFSLPSGLHSFAYAVYNGKWLFICGRTNGIHTFDPDNNFPALDQNTVIYLVDPVTKTTISRSLAAPTAGLTQAQIDTLSVTSPQFYTSGSTLYITGGYGIDTITGAFTTKDTLTAINLPGLMHWMIEPVFGETAADYIRQIHHSIFQVAGGYMNQFPGHATLLVMGQNFAGFYTDGSNGIYSEKIRRFNIIDDGVNLSVNVRSSIPKLHETSLRRRDLNVVPILFHKSGRYRTELIAFSGVFTPLGGIWTVPVVIAADGKTKVKDPAFHHNAFKQGMNNYICPTAGLYSKATHNMYSLFFGGLSYGYFVGRNFITDAEIPFINQITTIQYDKHGHFSQYLMEAEYPVILSTGSNPGNPLLFGANAVFIPSAEVLKYGKEVLNYDSLVGPTVIGHIVGGIQSTLPNTNVASDSTASAHIFIVTLTPTAVP